MHSLSIREEDSQSCFSGLCPRPFLGLPDLQSPTSRTIAAAFRHDFEVAMASSTLPNSQFTNHESLPLLHESFASFSKSFPQYLQTNQADRIRQQEYYHLSLSNHVCLDYVGHGLFSYSHEQSQCQAAPVASTSSASPPPVHSTSLEVPPFFDIFYKSINLYSQIQHGGQESELEHKIRKRIMAFMNISEDDYAMVFTANQSSAFKLLADSYPFQSNPNLITVYDYENEAVKAMIESSKSKGAQIMSAEFAWPTLRIQSGKLLKKVLSKRKKRKKGLFVFPLQSRTTGARYSYLWMSMAHENGWHVLLDACALGPKQMETLGLSLFKPDFLICSFFKVFGENPSGFGCLFVKKSSASVLTGSSTATSLGIVKLVPSTRSSLLSEDSSTADIETDQKAELVLHGADNTFQGSSSGPMSSQLETTNVREIEEVTVNQKVSQTGQLESTYESKQSTIIQTSANGNSEHICRGLDHADSLGLILISARARYLINWLVNALMSLHHPHAENGLPLVRIYGPKIKFDRGPAVAFNVYDWKGEKIDPAIVQKLADRNNISLSCGFLHHIWFADKHEEERERTMATIGGETVLNEKREKLHSGISVVSAALGLMTNFEDIYRLWAFVSRFLDADFLEREKWRYTALNQKTIEV